MQIRAPHVYALVFLSGLAGLSWEVLWQHHAGLAIGVSAAGIALTLACTMGGLAVGAVWMGRWLRRPRALSPLQLYGLLEGLIGVSGLSLPYGFAALEQADRAVWAAAPAWAPLAQVLGIALLLGPPTLAMGATVPVFERLAPAAGTSIARLYGLNTVGAAGGVVLAAFVLLPGLGVELTGALATVINLAVAALAWTLGRGQPAHADPSTADGGRPPASATLGRAAVAVAFTTGFATFALEVAWFRSLRAAYQATTDSFAVILVAVLAPLALGARLAAGLRRRPGTLPLALVGAGVLVLLATPVIERFDALVPATGTYGSVLAWRLGAAMLAMGPPILVLGVALPWLLEQARTPAEAGRLYGANTVGALAGSLVAAWLLLPGLGFARTAWGVGVVLAAAGLAWGGSSRARAVGVGALAAALTVAVVGESGVGRLRAQGLHLAGAHTVLYAQDGPDATVSVVEYPTGVRELVIDGFQTSGEADTGHYMVWMGRLPMLLHPKPERGLVICFGTGQTANAVRREGVGALDIVELSDAVIGAAPLFTSNEGVVQDPRVQTHIMDGRAWLRRTDRAYDVVTLEPMAPHFAGTNSLYSREFYALIRDRLKPGGVVAQWLPLHLVTPEEAVAAARSFQAELPNSALWLDPLDRTGILVGKVEPGPWRWPGLARAVGGRDLTPAQIRDALLLEGEAFTQYASLGELITDDNQLLAYGPGRRQMWQYGTNSTVHDANVDIIRKIRAQARAAR